LSGQRKDVELEIGGAEIRAPEACKRQHEREEVSELRWSG
jgi:hypothetical protein